MSLRLTSADQRRLGAAAEAMLSALAAPGAEAWWDAVEARMRALFPRANAMLARFDVQRPVYASSTADPSALRCLTELTSVDPHRGVTMSTDPVPDTWYRYRRAHGIGVWDEPLHLRLMQELGLDVGRSPFRMDGLLACGLHRYAGITSALPDGSELILTVGYDRAARSRFGDDDAALVGLLLPSLRAAHHALATLAPRQAALAATLDAADDALLVVAADGRTLHRSAALQRALVTEPERERVMDAMRDAARAMRVLGAGRALAGPASGAERTVATARARWVVRAAFGSPLVWGEPGIVLVSLASRAGPAAPADAARALGLTPREAQVAALLAGRMTNAEVAAALGVSVHTARHHTERVMRKLDVGSRRALAMRLQGVSAGAGTPSG